MKRQYLILLYSTLMGSSSLCNKFEPIKVTIKSQWQYLDSNEERSVQFGGNWVLVGTVSIKKRMREPVAISQVTFRWQGDTLDSLSGSLFQKKPNKEFLAIEQNIICDSLWNKRDQTLLFKFSEPLSLDSLTILNLVLTVPSEVETVLQKGFFVVDKESLPYQIQESLHKKPLLLSFNTKR